MKDIERLIAIEEIGTLCARKLRHMDCKEWDQYGAVHTEDAWSEAYSSFSPNDPPATADANNRVTGRQALADAIRHSLTHNTPVTTVHHIHQGEIDFISDTTASGIWAMEHMGWWRNGDHDERIHGYGHYHETYRK